MASITDWLRFFRAEKSPTTVLRVELFYLIAGGSFLSWFNAALVLWATLLHWLAFGHNTLMDTSRGFDTENPKRKHDPLVSGKIQLDEAHNIVNWLTILAALAGIVLVYTSRGDWVLALMFLLIYAVAGHSYNDGLDKSTVVGFIPYTISYTALCAMSFFLGAQAISLSQTTWLLFLLAIIYIVLVEMFEVGWEGSLKDIQLEKERNWLRAIGCKVDKGKFRCSFRARLFGYGLKIFSIVPLFLTNQINIQLTAPGVSAFVLLVIVIVFAVLLIETRDHNYNRDILFILIEDLASLLLLPVIFVAVIGGVAVICMVLYPIIWFVLFNLILWSSVYKMKE